MHIVYWTDIQFFTKLELSQIIDGWIMFRFAFLVVASFVLSSQAIAAVKWNNGGSSSGTGDPKNYWRKAEKAKRCFGPEFDHFKDKISLKKIKVPSSDFEKINTPFGLQNSNQCKFSRIDLAAQIVPEPLIDARINSQYGGDDHKRFAPYYEFLSVNIGLNRREPHGIAQERLKQFLLTWSQSNALSKNIRFTLNQSFRLDYHIQTLIPLLITAFSDLSEDLTSTQKTEIGQWINRLVEDSQRSQFMSRQDNKAYLQHLTALMWGIVIKNDDLIDQSRNAYQTAILDMRPDGTFPLEVSRGGSGLQYQNTAVNVLMTMAAFSTLISENWIEYEVNGRSLKAAVQWLDSASSDPSMNKIYARTCDGGSFASIDNPNMNYLNKQETGESELSWVPLYRFMTGETPEFMAKGMRSYKGYWSKSAGPNACLFVTE